MLCYRILDTEGLNIITTTPRPRRTPGSDEDKTGLYQRCLSIAQVNCLYFLLQLKAAHQALFDAGISPDIKI